MVRAWFGLVWKSAAVAVVAVAAQVGLGETVGILRWSDTSADATSTLLTWVGFIYAGSVLIGSAAGWRSMRTPGQRGGVPAAVLAAVAAGLGAAVAGSLVWLAAQSAVVPVAAFPELRAATTAGAGVVVGIVLSIFAALVPAAAVNAWVIVAWIWAVGLFGAVAGYVTHAYFAPPRLAVIDAPSLVPAEVWTGPYVMVALAALAGAGVAAVARFGGAGRVGAAVSGLGGPAIVAAAYIIVMPATQQAQAGQLDAYRAALYALGAGLLGSALVAIPGRKRAPRPRPQPEPAAALPTRPPVTYRRPDDDTEVLTVPAAPRAPLMGQPRSYEEDYSDWLRELGPGSQQGTVYGGTNGNP